MKKIKEQASKRLSHHFSRRYVYDELKDEKAIRVLQLHPTKNGLECTLQQIKYSDRGYQALSYVWGSPEKHHKMVVRDENGKSLGFIPLTENLRNALHDLRDSSEVQDKVFWIDQISINQQNDEKNHQVALMGKIYENAARVIVYAGPGPVHLEEEERGIALMLLLNEHYAENLEMLKQYPSLHQANLVKFQFPVQVAPEALAHGRIAEADIRHVGEGWAWLLQMVYGEWTRRLWIVQELLLNDELVVLRGLRLFSWDSVAATAILEILDISDILGPHVERFWRENLAGTELKPDDFAHYYFSIWHPRQHQTRGPVAHRTLLENIYWYDDLECWDPRDRMYALLSISSDATELEITPDYSETSTVSSIYLDLSVRILQASLDLDMLVYVCRWAPLETRLEDSTHAVSKRTQRWPSWALSACHRPLPVVIVNEWNPHPQTSLIGTVRILPNHSLLVLKGRVIDAVSFSAPVDWMPTSVRMGERDASSLEYYSRQLHNIQAALQYVGVTVEQAASLCCTTVTSSSWTHFSLDGHSGEEAFAFVLFSYFRMMSNWLRDGTWTSDLGSLLENTLKQYEQFILVLAALFMDQPRLSVFDPASNLTNKEIDCAQDLLARFLRYGRSLCVSKAGRFCNVMYQAQDGDVFAAFQGSNRLWLLRPVGTQYRLIGDAYVDGLMKGEAYEGLDFHEVDYDIELI